MMFPPSRWTGNTFFLSGGLKRRFEEVVVGRDVKTRRSGDAAAAVRGRHHL